MLWKGKAGRKVKDDQVLTPTRIQSSRVDRGSSSHFSNVGSKAKTPLQDGIRPANVPSSSLP